MSETIFQFPYKVLSILGLWDINSENRVVKILYFIYQSCALLYLAVFVCFLIRDLYSVWKDIHKASTNLSATMTVVMLLWKNTQGLQRLPLVRELQEDLNKGLHSTNFEEDKRILRRAALEMKSTCAAVYCMGMATLTGWLTSELMLRPKAVEDNLPFPVYIPWDHHVSPYYELALLFQSYGGYLVTFDVLSFNLTIFGTIVQICAEYNILLKNTERINEWHEKLCETDKGVRALTEMENKEAEEMIIRNIKHHQKIIHCVNKAETFYVHMMLIQFGGSAILITVVFFDLILVTRELNYRLYPLMIFLTLVISDIFLFCNYGSRLISKSHEFLNRIYGTPWEVMNSKNRKTISIIILKAQRPPKLTVEKFANIDLYSLLNLTNIVYKVLYLLLYLAKKR